MNLGPWFGVAFLLGVAGAVYFLTRGAERRATKSRTVLVDEFGREAGPRAITLALPGVSAGLAAFGLIGYLVSRLTRSNVTLSLAAAAVAAVVLGVLAARLVAQWAGYAARNDAPDERYVLQGHVATVIAASPDRAEVEYTANGRRVVAPARSVSGAPLIRGSEVVIERVEEGIVYVEAWSHVEQRI
jgi:anti-sigma factor RsiW